MCLKNNNNNNELIVRLDFYVNKYAKLYLFFCNFGSFLQIKNDFELLSDCIKKIMNHIIKLSSVWCLAQSFPSRGFGSVSRLKPPCAEHIPWNVRLYSRYNLIHI